MKKYLIILVLLASLSTFAQTPYHVSFGGGGLMHKGTYIGASEISFSRSFWDGSLRVGADALLSEKLAGGGYLQKYVLYGAIGTENENSGISVGFGPSYLNAPNISCVGFDAHIRMYASLYKNLCIGAKIGSNWNKQYSPLGQFSFFLMYKF
jgi:hypothetical protein